MGAELIALFEESVIVVRHLDAGARFTVGESKLADLPWSGLGALRELVRVRESCIELVHADEVSVELLDGDGEPQWTRELPDERRVAIVPPGRRARLTIGALTLLVAPSERPRALPLAPVLSWKEHFVTGVVALCAALFLLALNAIPESPSSLALDDALVTQRLARFVLHPPVPPPTHDTGTQVATGGGRTSAPAPRRRTTAPNPDTSIAKKSGSPRDARQAAVAAASKAGILGLIEQSQVGSIFGGSSAIGAEGTLAMGAMDGTSLTGGCGGCANGPLVQGGPGGNGTSIGAGPLSTHDGTSRTPGRPDLALRRASSIIDTPTPQVHVIGGGDRELIRRVIRMHMAEFRYCYERELQRDSTLTGRVVPRFTIDPLGRVIAAMIESSSMHSPAVESCVLQTTKRLEFSKAPQGGGLTIVSYPFAFKSASQN